MTMYVISVKHYSVKGQHDVAGEDREDCLEALLKSYPKGDYVIVSEGEK